MCYDTDVSKDRSSVWSEDNVKTIMCNVLSIMSILLDLHKCSVNRIKWSFVLAHGNRCEEPNDEMDIESLIQFA